ncbi:MAG: RluA family pseudouridine synthase [Myxococcota bacterium]
MNEHERKLVVSPEQEGRRLDLVVSSCLPELSRSRVQQLLAEARVTVEGRSARASHRARAGEVILVRIPSPVLPEEGPLAQDIPFGIIHEDEEIVVVDKPAGMAVHPAPGSPDRTLVNALLHKITDLQGIGGELRPGIVHRLDKDTTGVMVVAKSDRALSRLQEEFKSRRVEKVYWALVHGVPRCGSGVIDRPLFRHPRDRKRFTGRGEPGSGARAARTGYRVLEVFDGASLVEARPETGRTHQIRVHLSEAGHPLLGDAVYGGTRRDRTSPVSAVRQAAKSLGHHALHARRLAFQHPRTREKVAFEAPLPEEWQDALRALRGA